METLPDEMFTAVKNAPVCKKLLNPSDCTPNCTAGYDFTVKGEHFQKCKNSCFMFDLNEGNNPYITAFAEHEIKSRA